MSYVANQTRSMTTILNLNDDCLVEVFLYLNTNDLLNVFEVHSQFEVPSEKAFERINLEIPMVVSNIVRMVKYSSRLLKTFGHLITKLCIEFKLHKIDRLLEAIVKHCDKNVTELEFRHIEPLTLYDNGLQEIRSFLRQLNTQFPNLLSLKFDNCNISKDCPYSDEIVQAIPNLISFTADGQLFSFKNLKKFIDLNGQLQSLVLMCELKNFMETVHTLHLSENFITYLDASLPMLKHLEINRVSIENIPQLVEYPKRFKNLKKLTFGSLPTTNFPDRGYLSFLGEDIEDVELYSFECSITRFAETMTRFKKLKILTLNLENSLEFRGAVTFLLITNETLVWSPQGIRQLILGNNQLTKIVIRRHQTGHQGYYAHRYDNLEIMYRDVIKDKLNGAQWKVDGVAKYFMFSKVEQFLQ